MNRSPKDFFIAAFWAPPALFFIFFIRFLLIFQRNHSFYEIWHIAIHDEFILGFCFWVSWLCLVVAILLSPLTKKISERYGPQCIYPDSKFINAVVIIWYVMTFVGPLIGWVIAGYFTLDSLKADNWQLRLWIRIILAALPLLLMIGPLAYAWLNKSLATLLLLPLFVIVPLVSIISPAYDLYAGPRKVLANIENIIWLSPDTGLIFLESEHSFHFNQKHDKKKQFRKGDIFDGQVLDGMRLILP